jgi:hypothetical protein
VNPAQVIEQERRIVEKIAPQTSPPEQEVIEEGPAPVNGRAGFSAALQGQMEGTGPAELQQVVETTAKPRQRRSRGEDQSPAVSVATTSDNTYESAYTRRWAVELAIPWVKESGGDVFEIAQALVDFVNGKQ